MIDNLRTLPRWRKVLLVVVAVWFVYWLSAFIGVVSDGEGELHPFGLIVWLALVAAVVMAILRLGRKPPDAA